ncbi:unnamed protein product [Adineta steineri]|uniref:Uncharacterized protein n=1 Tax=Adineta steineri TaxID=433720 RepID=A0A815IQ75_9BILA|nr:unnamed protein product [Adineta steineri]
MQDDLNKEASDNYGNADSNQYPPMNQPQFGPGNMHSPNNATPPPSGYPAPGQAPMIQQQRFIVIPNYRLWNIIQLTPIKSNIKAFLIISGIFYMIWGIIAFGLEIGIITSAYLTYYRGIWAGVFLIGGGISMLVVACKKAKNLNKLILTFTVTMIICIFALLSSILNIYGLSRCNPDPHWYNYCDRLLATNLKIVILVLFVIANIHSIINMFVTGKVQKRAATTSPTNIPN